MLSAVSAAPPTMRLLSVGPAMTEAASARMDAGKTQLGGETDRT
jgi:hypothetical protein